jgi:hypothetical protein
VFAITKIYCLINFHSCVWRTTGNEPLASKNTYITLNVKEGLKLRRWSAGVVTSDDNKVTVEVRLPGDTIVGKWQVHVDTTPVIVPVTEVNDLDAPPPPRTIHRYTHPHPVYIIFNPWSSGWYSCLADACKLQ